MKKIYFTRLLSLLLLCLLAPLVSCDKDGNPTKNLRYTIKLRVVGENLTGLAAGMQYASVRTTLTDPKPGPSGVHTYASRIDTTYNLGEFGWYDHLEATIFLRNATCDASTHPRPGSFLRLEVLVNGLVANRAELNATSARTVTCSPYWQYTYGADGDDWDD